MVHSKYDQQPNAKSISVLGVEFTVSQVTINGVDAQFSYDPKSLKLLINQTIDLRKQFIVIWT